MAGFHYIEIPNNDIGPVSINRWRRINIGTGNAILEIKKYLNETFNWSTLQHKVIYEMI